MVIHVGIDDTDSPKGGCTTYIAAVYAEKLLQMGARFIDYPTLLRLNPNTPWKTRGNAAVCLRFEIRENEHEKVKETVLDLVEQYGEFWCENTNPGIVFLEGQVSQTVKDFSRRVVQQIVDLEEAEPIIHQEGLSAIGYKNRRGLIGALASIGGTLEGDHTFELLTYRAPENWGTPRLIDKESIEDMSNETLGLTYNNLDEEGKILITPRGPDPVLYGIRGESAVGVYDASKMVIPLEDVERWMIYRSNQGTDAHFSKTVNVDEVSPFNPVIIKGRVTGNPVTISGGHVIFNVEDSTGAVDCAAYEPTGSFRGIIRGLIQGDHVRVYAGVRPRKKTVTLNVEKIEILDLAEKVEYGNPKCPECSGGMESMGSSKGYRCRKCGYRDGSLQKITTILDRELMLGIYLPDKNAQRHLTKPLERYGREKECVQEPLISHWISGSAQR